MCQTATRLRSRGAIAPESCIACLPQKTEGAGNARCFSRTHSLMCSGRKHMSSHYRLAVSPAFPARWFSGLLRALPGVHDLSVTVARRLVTCKLSTSPGGLGPHAFAVRGSRVSSCACPSHPKSNVRDDAPAPRVETGCESCNMNFRKTEYKKMMLIKRNKPSTGPS
jgi:hypothetical protein